MRVVALLFLLAASTASAQPAPTATDPWTAPIAPRSEPEPEPLIRDCVPVYAEGHLLVGSSTGPGLVPDATIARWGLGVRVCTKVDVQAGVVWDLGMNTDYPALKVYSAFGGEARVMLRLPELRIGPHVAVLKSYYADTTNVSVWVGARIERGSVVFGLDVMRIPGAYREGPYDVWGLYGSIGLRGSWVQLVGLAAVSAIAAGNIVFNEHGD